MPGYAIAAALLLLAIARDAGATTRTVCASGCGFTTIQAAQNASAAGDTIDVRGPLTEQGIILDRTLIILSSLPQAPVVQAATQSGVATDRVFYIAPGVTVLMQNLRLRNGNFPSGAGGGIAAFGGLILKNCTVSDCVASSGGGIYAAGLLQLIETTVERNHAFAHGGGILAQGANAFLERSTLALNFAFEGGGIKVSGGSAILQNCTVSLNRANNGGGGLFDEFGATSQLFSCTFAQNTLRAVQSNGSSSVVYVQNSILARSLTSTFLPGGPDLATFSGGAIVDDGYNIVQSPNGVAFTQPTTTINQDPGLSPLSQHGGPTRTHALATTSIARNTGSVGVLAVDQRGFARLAGGVSDRGAFEARTVGAEPVLTDSMAMAMSVSGEVHYGEFRTFRVRGPSFAVNRGLTASVGVALAPDTTQYQTYMGLCSDLPAGIAGATWFADSGTVAWHLQFEDGHEWQNEGAETAAIAIDKTPAWTFFVPKAGATGGTLVAADIGVDVPNEPYAAAYRGNVTRATAMIEHCMLATNLVYMRQVGVRVRLGRVILRTDSANDIYFGVSRHDTLLARLGRYWNTYVPTTMASAMIVTRNVASLSGGGAGLGNVGGAGAPRAYATSDGTARGDFSRAYRHELGHNFGINHLTSESPEGHTILSGNKLARFSGAEQYVFETYRNANIGGFPAQPAYTVPMPPFAASDQMFVSATFAGVWDLNVLANDHDLNGDAITLVSVNGVSVGPAGGTLAMTVTPGVVRYTPPISPSPADPFDCFEYRIRDASGLESIGYVFVRLMDFIAGSHYSQNFSGYPDSTFALTDGSYFTRTKVESARPFVSGGALTLIPNVTFTRTGMTLPPMGMHQGFDLSFRFRITSSGTPADGFTLGYGQSMGLFNPPAGFVSDYADGLSLEFNTFSAPGFWASVNSAPANGVPMTLPGITDGAWHTAAVRWVPSDGLSFTLDGAPTIVNLPTPGFAPTRTSLLSFSSFNGGFTESVQLDDIVVAQAQLAGVGDDAPLAFALHANAPSPFRGSTTLRFDLPRAASVRLAVHDLQGRRVRDLISDVGYAAGRHTIGWNGDDDDGRHLPPGVYLERLEVEGRSVSRRVVLLR